MKKVHIDFDMTCYRNSELLDSILNMLTKTLTPQNIDADRLYEQYDNTCTGLVQEDIVNPAEIIEAYSQLDLEAFASELDPLREFIKYNQNIEPIIYTDSPNIFAKNILNIAEIDLPVIGINDFNWQPKTINLRVIQPDLLIDDSEEKVKVARQYGEAIHIGEDYDCLSDIRL